MVLRNSSNSSSSVMPHIYMKRFLKVGEASLKMVCPPGSWHTDVTAQALMRGSLPVSTVPNSEPKLVPETPMRAASSSGRAAIEELVAVKRNLDFLVAVHAGNGDHDRQSPAAVARRQMQPSGDRLVL